MCCCDAEDLQDGTTTWRSTSDGVKPGLDVFLELRLYIRLVGLMLRKKMMTLINVQWLMTAFCLLNYSMTFRTLGNEEFPPCHNQYPQSNINRSRTEFKTAM